MESRVVVECVADEVLTRETVKEFVDTSFIRVLEERGLSPSQTQARASVTGEVFELCVSVVFERLFEGVRFERGVSLPGALMTGSAGADFVLYDSSGEVSAVVEAKGSADRLVWSDGTVQEPSRPGLQRSDTMKKAVCQGYQVSRGLDESVGFYVVTSHMPKPGSSVEALYEMAVGDVIDDGVCLHNVEEVECMLSSAGVL